jgi:hypothetical protein
MSNKFQILADVGLNPFAYQLLAESVSRREDEISHVELVWDHYKDKTKQIRVTVTIEPFGEGPVLVVKSKDGEIILDNQGKVKR